MTPRTYLWMFVFFAVAKQAAAEGIVVEHYVIGREILQYTWEDCDYVPDAFDRAVCRFHVPRARDERAAATRLASTFQELQRKGLVSAKQTLANLLEGLLHARVARLTYDATLPKGQLQSVAYCTHRRQALSNLANVALPPGGQVYYASGTGLTMEELFAEVAANYDPKSGPLTPSRATDCGENATYDPDKRKKHIKALVEAAYVDLRQQYLVGASAPLSAMFVRRKSAAERVDAKVKAEIESLKTSVKASTDKAMAVERYYQSNIEAKLTSLMEAYLDVLARASAIQKSYDSWRNGLFQPVSGETNYAVQLDGHHADLQSQQTSLRANTQTIAGTSAVTEHLADLHRENRRLARRYCRVYYCGLSAREDMAWLTGDHFDSACNRLQNVFCHHGSMRFEMDGAYFTPEQFCTSVGFEPRTYVTGRTIPANEPVRLNEQEAKTCWQQADAEEGRHE